MASEIMQVFSEMKASHEEFKDVSCIAEIQSGILLSTKECIL